MTRRRPGADMRRPVNAAHRYQLVVDAVAGLDIDALYDLVVTYRASVDEITRAAAQTDRTTAELTAALRDWLAEVAITRPARSRLIVALTQPTLIPLGDLS